MQIWGKFKEKTILGYHTKGLVSLITRRICREGHDEIFEPGFQPPGETLHEFKKHQRMRVEPTTSTKPDFSSVG